jgi:hypothetical protein
MSGRVRWIAGRLARLGLDAVVVAGGLARMVTIAVRPAPRHAGLALLAGDEVARRGVTSIYRVRVYNPAATACTLTVTVDGGRDAVKTPTFRLTWTTTLAPHAAEDRWIETAWQDGAAALSVTPPSETAIVAVGTAPLGSWWIEASATPADSTGRQLRIAGALVA